MQVDAVVYSINPQGFFAQAGPLRLFVSAHVRNTRDLTTNASATYVLTPMIVDS